LSKWRLDGCLTLLTLPSVIILSQMVFQSGIRGSSETQCVYVASSHQVGSFCIALRCGGEFRKVFISASAFHTVTVQNTMFLSINSLPATKPGVMSNCFTDLLLLDRKPGKYQIDLKRSRVMEIKNILSTLNTL